MLLGYEIRDRLRDLGAGYKVSNATYMGKCELGAISMYPQSNEAQSLRVSNRNWLKKSNCEARDESREGARRCIIACPLIGRHADQSKMTLSSMIIQFG